MTTDQQAESDGIRGYLQSQGEKYSFVEIWPRAVRARLEVIDALDGVGEAQAAFKPGTEDWSIREVALHVLRGSHSVRALVTALAQGQSAPSGRVDPPRESAESPIAALREQLLRDGVEWSAAIVDLPERPPLEPVAPHSTFGDLHARGWYLFQRTHDIDHANQITAVKESSGFPPA